MSGSSLEKSNQGDAAGEERLALPESAISQGSNPKEELSADLSSQPWHWLFPLEAFDYPLVAIFWMTARGDRSKTSGLGEVSSRVMLSCN